MNILIVSQYFWPEPFRINDLCEAFIDRGHKVTVLTGLPNYPEGKVYKDYIEKPEVFNNFKGCNVVRVPIISRGSGSSFKLALNYLSYVVSGSTVGLWKLRKKKFDVVFVFQLSPITSAIPAILIRALKKTPLVMWVLDLWPESLRDAGGIKSERVQTLVGKLVKFIYNRCDLILGQSERFKVEILKRTKHKNVEYFANWAEDLFSHHGGVTDLIPYREGVFKILFAGNVGESQDFETIVCAFNKVREIGLPIKLYIVGDGRALSELRRLLIESELEDYIILLGRHPLESMPAFYEAADFCLVTLKDSPAFSMTLPGKVQSYMAAGKPILAILSGEGGDIIRKSKAGLVATPGNLEEIMDCLCEISQMNKDKINLFGTNSRSFYEENFERKNQVSKLLTYLESVVGENEC